MSGTRSVEEVKVTSHGLRGSIAATLEDHTQSGFSEDDKSVIKFHGFYQQGNRDDKTDKTATFMIRARVPGGRVDARQWLQFDRIADAYGGGSIRLTTRMTVQFHGVVKDDLRPLMQAIDEVNLTTKGACGDVVRNVCYPVNPLANERLTQLEPWAQLLSDHFQFRSAAWTELWLAGERVKVPGDEFEPFYGKTYLPRKFKIALTAEGDNSVDLLTNDLGAAATFDANGQIDGWHLFAGGGMGMTHNKPETYPRLADHVGWVPVQELLPAAEAIIGVHRDFGDRTNRKHARLKYVIQEQGLAWFRAEVEKRSGLRFLVAREIPTWHTPSWHGWHQAPDGSWALGFSIPSGRLRDDEGKPPLKSAIRRIVAAYGLSVQMTADQDLILTGISDAQKARIEQILAAKGIEPKPANALRTRALACVSMPTCPLAMAESERVLDPIMTDIGTVLERLGLMNRAPVVRITGCPNGCARPYSAEIGIVGQAANRYAIFIGGTPQGTALARLWTQKVALADIGKTLEPALILWKVEGQGMSFGDFVRSVDFGRLRTMA